MPTEYIETFEFQLNADSSEKDLLEGFEKSNQWFAQNPAFIYRSLAYNEENNSWQDVLYWRSAEAAKQAGETFINEPLNQLFAQQIDVGSLRVVKHKVKAEFYTGGSCD